MAASDNANLTYWNYYASPAAHAPLVGPSSPRSSAAAEPSAKHGGCFAPFKALRGCFKPSASKRARSCSDHHEQSDFLPKRRYSDHVNNYMAIMNKY